MWREADHPRDSSGRFADKGGDRGPNPYVAMGELGGSIGASLLGDRLGMKGFDAAMARWKIPIAGRAARYGIPLLRFGTGLAVGSALSGPGGIVGALLTTGAITAFDAYRNWNKGAEMKKRAPGGEPSTMDIFLPLAKVDEEQQIIVARAAVEEPDRQKEIMDYDAAKLAFVEWSDQTKKASGGKSLGNVRVMHQPRVAGRVVDIQFNDLERAVDVAIKVDDPTLWEMCKSGSYTGLSIGGGYARKWKDPSNAALTRYAPSLSEISIVDRPCIPSATFQILKADGLVETRHFDDSVVVTPKSFGDELRKAERVEHSRLLDTLNGWGRPRLGKAFDESKVKRDDDGKFAAKAGASDDATYAAQVGAGAAASAVGFAGAAAAARAASVGAGKTIQHATESRLRLMTRKMGGSPNSTFARFNVKEAKFHGRMAGGGARAAMVGAAALAGSSFGDYVGDRAARESLGRGDKEYRPISLTGALAGFGAGAAAETLSDLGRKARKSPLKRIGRGFLAGTIGAVAGELGGNMIDRQLGLTSAMTSGWDGGGRAMKADGLQKAEKDGRAGRDADGDGKFNEGKDNEGGDGRAKDAPSGEQKGNPKAPPKEKATGGEGGNGGVKSEVKISETASVEGHKARQQGDAGYRATTTDVIPEKRGALYGGAIGGALGGIGAGAWGAMFAYPGARGAVMDRMNQFYENGIGMIGRGLFRTGRAIAPMASDPALDRWGNIGETIGRRGFRGVTWAYQGAKTRVADALVRGVGSRRLAAGILGGTAGFFGARSGAGYGSWVGENIYDPLAARRVEKGDGMFYDALRERPKTFLEAAGDRPVTFAGAMLKWDESKVKRDNLGRFTFKDAAIAVGAGLAAAAGGLAAARYLVRRYGDKALKGEVTRITRALGERAKGVLVESKNQLSSEVKQYIDEFRNATLIDKIVKIRRAGEAAAIVGGGLYLANKLVRDGTAEIGFTDGGIRGALYIREGEADREFASFDSSTGAVRVPGLLPGERASTTVAGSSDKKIDYRGDAKDLSPQQAAARRSESFANERKRVTDPDSVAEYAKSFEARIDDIVGIAEDQSNGWFTSDKKELIRLIEFSDVPGDKRPSGQHEVSQYLERRIGSRDKLYPSDRKDVADYHRAIVRYIGSDLPQQQKDQLYHRINSKVPKEGWVTRAPKPETPPSGGAPSPKPASPSPAPAPTPPQEQRRESNIAAVTEKRSEGKMIWDRAGMTKDQWDAMSDKERSEAFGRFAKADFLPNASRFI